MIYTHIALNMMSLQGILFACLTFPFISSESDLGYNKVCSLKSSSALQKALDGIGITVPCDTEFAPVDCDFTKIPLLKVEDFERCGPVMLNRSARNYFLGAAGRRLTYKANKSAYKRIRIVPKIFRDVSKWDLKISTLGQDLSFPVGLSPVAAQKLAHPLGEIATAQAISNMGIIMILSCHATTTLEEVAHHASGGTSHLWIQTNIFPNRSITVDLVSRAEKAGFKGVVVLMDSPVDGTITCDAKEVLDYVPAPNLPKGHYNMALYDKSLTFKDLSWIRSITKLPIIVKGILSAQDAISSIRAGASAILVSNHGGRQLDSGLATIDALPCIADAVHKVNPRIDVYVDGGIRNGWDIYKAIASGAKMVFIGRSQVYGLAIEGREGVRDILTILRSEFEEAMILAGASHPSKISRDTVRRSSKC